MTNPYPAANSLDVYIGEPLTDEMVDSIISKLQLLGYGALAGNKEEVPDVANVSLIFHLSHF